MRDWARWCRRVLVAAGVVALAMGGVSIFGQPDREILYQPEPPLSVCGSHGCTFIYRLEVGNRGAGPQDEVIGRLRREVVEAAILPVVAYAGWGNLLQRYPAAAVSPFALIAPCTGVPASALVFGEVFGPIRYAGMLLILGGLAVIVLPTSRKGAQAP